MKSIKKTLAFAIMTILAITGISSFVRADDNSDYVYGKTEYHSSYSSDVLIQDSFYYSDKWLLSDPAERNDKLALISMQLFAADPDGGSDTSTISFLNKLGFLNTGIAGSDRSAKYVWGKKNITAEAGNETLIAVVIQSYSNDKAQKADNWKDNFTVNGQEIEDEHFAFSQAAEDIIDDIVSLAGSENNVRYWIMGQSRGGAISNILAAHLPEKLPSAKDSIYAYTFEAPATVEKSAVEGSAGQYGYIHNYVSDDDIVTMIPPWDMTRYGTDHLLNTEEADMVLFDILKNMGSPAFDGEDGYNGLKEMAEPLIQKLVLQITSREAYSAVHKDVFTDSKGKTVAIEYSYQSLLQRVIEFAIGGNMPSISSDTLVDELDLAANIIDTLAEASRNNSPEKFWMAAQKTQGLLADVNISLPFTTNDLYVLLKLVSPVLLNLDYHPAEGEYPLGIVMGYLGKTVVLITDAKTFVFSHHYDVIIARLKALAGAPELEAIDIVITPPTAGDAPDKAINEIKSDIASRFGEWLEVNAEWESDFNVLENDTVYYLNIELSAAGHSIPEGYDFTLNGQTAFNGISAAYKDGIPTASGTWRIVIGSPKMVSVKFDNAGHGTAPAGIQLAKGEMLKYAASPADLGMITDETGTWIFKDWIDKNGTSWKDITVHKDTVLYAKWSAVINNIALTFEIPKAGGPLTTPKVPKNALYKITDSDIMGPDYDTVTSIEEDTEYMLSVYIMPVDDAAFYLVEDEYDEMVYAGVITINGKEVEARYDGDGLYLNVEYLFKTPSYKNGIFPDVQDKSKAYYKPVYWAVENDIIRGYKNGYFGPYDPCTREQFVTMLWRMAGRPAVKLPAKSPFKDVSTTDSSYRAIVWAYNNDIIRGYTGTRDGYFGPKDTLYRKQVAVMLWRWAGRPKASVISNPFVDVKRTDSHYQATHWGAMRGVMRGSYDEAGRKLFKPDDICERQHAVIFLYRYARDVLHKDVRN